jgi:hypothetical protein
MTAKRITAAVLIALGLLGASAGTAATASASAPATFYHG